MKKNIAQNVQIYENREKPEKFTKYKSEKNHLSKEKQVKEYQYYVCDHCGDTIKILENGKNVDGNNIATGGVVKMPVTLTRTNKVIILALCNKCIKPVTKQFEERNMIEDNVSHIPTLS